MEAAFYIRESGEVRLVRLGRAIPELDQRPGHPGRECGVPKFISFASTLQLSTSMIGDRMYPSR